MSGRARPAAIPVVDISSFRDGSDPLGVAQRVDAACREIGFFVVTGHGFDLDLLHRVRHAAMRFFHLPLDRKVAATGQDFMGYSPFLGERLAYSLGELTPPDLKETFTLSRPAKDPDDPYFTHPDGAFLFPQNVFPLDLPSLEDVSKEFYWAMLDLCDGVLRLFATALGMPVDYFVQFNDKAAAAARYIYYPALTEPPLPGQLRAGVHSDYGSFTLVNFNDAPGGLQVRDRDGRWLDVPMVADSFVCNIGDLLQIWTNDRWVSSLHRVGVPPPGSGDAAERLTLVYFHDPNWDAVPVAIPSCIDEDHPPKYDPVTAAEHIRRKLTLSSAGVAADERPTGTQA